MKLMEMKERETMKTPPIVSPQNWEAARQQLLVKEKELTRARDALAAERRRMPWLAVKKNYKFDGPKGKVRLLDLFEGRRQLIVYRAFLEPGVKGWPEHACVGCSMVADQVAHVAHLNVRDTTLAFASRASQNDIARVKARMGWRWLGTPKRTAWTKTSGAMGGTGRTRLSAMATTYSAPTSSTTVAMSRWGTLGTTSISLRSGARRSGRTRRRATPRLRDI